MSTEVQAARGAADPERAEVRPREPGVLQHAQGADLARELLAVDYPRPAPQVHWLDTVEAAGGVQCAEGKGGGCEGRAGREVVQGE